LQQDQEKAMDLWKHAAKLGSSEAHFSLGSVYCEGGELKKAKFHYEAAALPRYRVGIMEGKSGNEQRALKHCILAASAGNHQAMRTLLNNFERGNVSRDAIDSTLIAYNISCAEMRSKA